jgi:hypothetical protein
MEDGPAVYRKASGRSLGGIVAEAVVNRDEARAEFSAERRALKAAALRPITDLIRADPSAAEAASKFRTLNRRLLSQDMARPLGNPVPRPVPVMVGQGTQVFIPPYDHSQMGPANGPPQDKDRAATSTGKLHLEAYPPYNWDGDFSASVGLGVDLQTSHDGWLEIRPLANVSYYGFAKGLDFSSHLESHIITSVLDLSTEKNVAAPPDYGVFYIDSDSETSDGLTLSAPYLAISVPAVRSVVYQVWFNVAIYGDQSGDDYWYGYSFAYGQMDISIPFFVTNLST